ncbi:mediator complex, subunit Med5 [Cercophora scortea]|uniref:Mediator of RNA polymerase II transcription subunit 5 n=1 Tax=Cercophora scortea TaxID=314031 RepID=A0AAE0IP84_9PEZI|nr:mediator complex, subunit Med5 [Cercophora scortea]
MDGTSSPAAGNVKGNATASVEQWTNFLSSAETRRLDADTFRTYAPMLHSKHRLPPSHIADLLLRPTRSHRHSLDPRVPQYLQALLALRLVDAASVLGALCKYSSSHAQADEVHRDQGRPQKKPKIERWRSSYASEEVIFWRLAKCMSQGTEVKSSSDAYRVAIMLARWMNLFTDAAAAFSRDAFGAMHSLQAKDDMENSRNAFLILLLGFCENHVALATLARPLARGARKHLSESLETFIPSIMQSSPEIAGTLERFRTLTLSSSEPADKKATAVSEMNSFMDNLIGLDSFQVPEIPVVNSRAGLYIYLNAALVGRPLIDDSALFTYLQNRYQGDIQTTAVQLILASFDVLANAVSHNEGSRTGHLLKSYLVNKVPLILGMLAASSHVYPFDAEFCITQALGQVDTNVFPTLAGMFDMQNNSSFQDSVRQDFCFACLLHGLLTQTAIETLLGDITYQSLPDEGRYIKGALVQSCLEDPEQTKKLIGELDNMNGNVGAAAQAIIEVIGSLCRNKETMTLKHLCSQLASKPLSLDILLLFDKPYKILHPLCELLDNWGGYDEDQGEYQPVYEEFGSIVLLLLAFVYRYNLSPADLGIRSMDSFVGKLLSRGSLSRPLNELSEQESSHINKWIHGLLDNEAGGLGDELMSSCPPQDFYLLIPTLFHQIVLALSIGSLTEDMLKGGLEYLVDVLLLPALVPAILFLSNQLWADATQGQHAIIRILQLILQPTSISNEASTMLASVLNIVAKPLDHSLRSYQRQDPKCQEIEPLLRALKESLPLSRRTGGADHTELECWTGTHASTTASGAGAAIHNMNNNMNNNGGSGSGANTSGLSAAVRSTITSLVHWAQITTLNGIPTTYTHRQILVALKIHGAKHLLAVLLEELKNQTEIGNGSIAYDVVTAIICAPDATSDYASTGGGAGGPGAAQLPDENGAYVIPLQRRLTLREALKAEADDWRAIQKRDPSMAETVVRLYRRVEAQMAPPPPPQDTPELGELGVVGAGELQEAMVAVAADSVDAMTLDTVDLGLRGSGVGVGDMDMVSATNSVGGGLDLGSDDIFGGLQMQGAGDFGSTDFSAWDSMILD